MEAWPATAAVRPLGGSAWPLGWRNRGGLCSTGHGQTVRRPAHPRRRRRAPSPRQARPRRSAEAVLRPNGRGGVRPGPAGARRRQRGRRAGRRPGRPHGYPGALWGGTAGFHTPSSAAGWDRRQNRPAAGPSTLGRNGAAGCAQPWPQTWSAAPELLDLLGGTDRRPLAKREIVDRCPLPAPAATSTRHHRPGSGRGSALPRPGGPS